MKKIIPAFFSIIIVSCSAQKQQDALINDFLETELSKMDADTIFMIEQPLQRIKTVEMYEQALAQKNIPNSSSEKKIWVYPELDSWPLTENDVAALKKKLFQEKEKEWSTKDFKNERFIILPEKKLRNKQFIRDHFGNNRIFNLSRPIFNKDRTYALFQYYPALLFGGGVSNNDGTIVMKREGEKWVRVAVFQYAVYH